MPLAATFLDWHPAFSSIGIAAIAAACGLVWLILRTGWGRSVTPRKWGWMVLRMISLGGVAAILLGPTLIDQQPGEATQPAMVMLVDGSQSMSLGGQSTRWQDAVAFLRDATGRAGAGGAGHCQWFRFGHRLQPFSDKLPTSANDLTLASTANQTDAEAVQPPDATDSRLADAMRQLMPQVGGQSTAGVVLVSDGRVRGTETVEQLARSMGQSGVPIHVVPVGGSEGLGDLAIVSLVVPDRVRKYTENELQVFLRSFGYTGERTTVRILSGNQSGTDAKTLASVPITLAGGPQSVSLPFRVGEDPEALTVVVDPLPGELTDRNNRVASRVEIDRTKIRVLYVDEGTAVQASYLSNLFGFGRSAPSSDDALTVPTALTADEDIECVALAAPGGSRPRILDRNRSGSDGFPDSRAELFAYDCVVLAGVGPGVLTEEQNLWLAQWVQGRGGGLIVTGAGALKPTDWQDSPISMLLPLDLSGAQPTAASSIDVEVTERRHPIWQLQLDQRVNDQSIDKLPPLSVGATGIAAKPSGEVLARAAAADAAPVVVAHRSGRGRVLASTADLGGTAFRELADSWGEQPDRVAAKFWRNLIYWSTEGASTGRRRLVAQSDKRFYRPGDRLSVSAVAYDESAATTGQYRVWAMFEPASLDDLSIYSPILWPDNTRRPSGEVGPRLAWGEELPLATPPGDGGYQLDMMLSETGGGDSGFRVELTAYEGEDSGELYDHGTQVDSTSLAVQVLSDPFEQQNPLPNHDLLRRIASLSGGAVLQSPDELATLLNDRPQTFGPPTRQQAPAWSTWWVWCLIVSSLTAEWVWRRLAGFA